MVLDEFYLITFRKKLYSDIYNSDIETLQKDLDEYIDAYNCKRTHQGERCKGRTPMETFIEGNKLFAEKIRTKDDSGITVIETQEGLTSVT